MKQKVNNSAFHDAFVNYGRTDNFSYEARDMLFDYFESIESDNGEEIELDVIAICCEYSEDSLEDVIANYSIDVSECEDDEDEDGKLEIVANYLENETSLIGVTSLNKFVYLAF
jgi:hypothetical protein